MYIFEQSNFLCQKVAKISVMFGEGGLNFFQYLKQSVKFVGFSWLRPLYERTQKNKTLKMKK